MSCFLVPLTQAVVTSAYRKLNPRPATSAFARNLHSLELMLWGGTAMLLVDHAVNGELFLPVQWKELLTVGLPMSVAVTAVWAILVLVKERSLKLQTK